MSLIVLLAVVSAVIAGRSLPKQEKLQAEKAIQIQQSKAMSNTLKDEFKAKKYQQLSDLSDEYVERILAAYESGFLSTLKAVSNGDGSTLALVNIYTAAKGGEAVCSDLCFLIVTDSTSTRIAQVFANFDKAGGGSSIRLLGFIDPAHALISEALIAEIDMFTYAGYAIDLTSTPTNPQRGSGIQIEIAQDVWQRKEPYTFKFNGHTVQVTITDQPEQRQRELTLFDDQGKSTTLVRSYAESKSNPDPNAWMYLDYGRIYREKKLFLWIYGGLYVYDPRTGIFSLG